MHWFSFAIIWILVLVGRTDSFQNKTKPQKVEHPVPVPSDSSNVLASVREYPSELHRCSATFVSHKALVTTATCVYCQSSCKLFIYALSSRLTDDGPQKGKSYIIKSIAIHPHFKLNSNNIAVIKLVNEVPIAKVFLLPDPEIFFSLSDNIFGNVYNWEFSNNLKDFYLHYKDATPISNGKCSLILNQYVDSYHVCAALLQGNIQMGYMDQGTPFTIKEKNKEYFIGMYSREGLIRSVKGEIFQSVSPYVKWIRQKLPDNPTSTLITTVPTTITSHPSTNSSGITTVTAPTTSLSTTESSTTFSSETITKSNETTSPRNEAIFTSETVLNSTEQTTANPTIPGAPGIRFNKSDNENSKENNSDQDFTMGSLDSTPNPVVSDAVPDTQHPTPVKANTNPKNKVTPSFSIVSPTTLRQDSTLEEDKTIGNKDSSKEIHETSSSKNFITDSTEILEITDKPKFFATKSGGHQNEIQFADYFDLKSTEHSAPVDTENSNAIKKSTSNEDSTEGSPKSWQKKGNATSANSANATQHLLEETEEFKSVEDFVTVSIKHEELTDNTLGHSTPLVAPSMETMKTMKPAHYSTLAPIDSDSQKPLSQSNKNTNSFRWKVFNWLGR